MVTIEPATTRRLVRSFVELPYSMYRRDPRFVPPLRRDEYRRFDAGHNPFLQHAAIHLWLALDEGRPVGRIAAIDDHLHNDTHQQRTTWFGFFEAADADVAARLFEAVEAHAARVGSTVVRGPVSPSLHEAAGLLVEGFDDAPCVLMAYNPATYPGFVEGAGYRKVKDLLSWEIDVTAPVPERVARIAQRVRDRHGVRVRTVDLRRFDAELDIVKTIYRAAWSDNWGFVPPTDAEIRQLAVELRPVADANLVLFAEIDGEPVGCALSIPDVNQVLQRMNGRLLPFGVLHFLRRRSIVSRVRMLMLGILPRARRLGLYPLLIAEAKMRTARAGYRRAEVGWTLEDNDLVNRGIEAAGGRHYKTHRLYEKAVD
jgi:GNAT superfamily N-acetyltransferase